MPRLRNIDSVERSLFLRFALLTGPALVAGAILVEWVKLGVNPWLWLLPDIGGAAVVVVVMFSLTMRAGGSVNSLLMPKGTPHQRQYSEQDALIAAGRINDAVDSFRSFLVAYPDDLDARLRLAALLAGPVNDPESAVHCFLEVRALGASPHQERIIGNALIDLHRTRGNRDGLKAELARFARLNQRSHAGKAARRHLRELMRDGDGEKAADS